MLLPLKMVQEAVRQECEERKPKSGRRQGTSPLEPGGSTACQHLGFGPVKGIPDF